MFKKGLYGTIAVIVGIILFTAFTACDDYNGTNGNNDDKFVDNPLIVNSYLHTTHDNKPMTVYYVLPPVIDSETRVLFVMHGQSRTAEGYARQFRPVSAAANVAIVAPLYDIETFGNAGYYLLNIGTASNPRPYSEWAFQYLDGIFHQFKEQHGISTEKYILYGFSAGGQFAHRTYMFSTSPYLDYVIAGGSGYYTLYDEKRNFSGGIQNLMIYEDILLDNLRNRKLYVVVGGDDNDPNDPQISSTSDYQGTHRVARAENYFETSRVYAEGKGINFNWEIKITDSGGHTPAPTIPYVAEVITRTTRQALTQIMPNLSDKNRIYGTWYLRGGNSAYIFRDNTLIFISSSDRFVISISDFEPVTNTAYAPQATYPNGYRIRGVYTEANQSSINIGDSFSRIFYISTDNTSIMRQNYNIWDRYR